MMIDQEPLWCDVRQHYCRCEYSQRCDRYDRERVVEELKQDDAPKPQPSDWDAEQVERQMQEEASNAAPIASTEEKK